MTDGAALLRLCPDARVAKLDGEAVVLHLRTGRYFALNRTGSALVARLETGASRADLVEALVAAHDAPRDRANADVDAWLASLRAEGLLAGAEGRGACPP